MPDAPRAIAPAVTRFSLMTYQEASPWATAIKESVLRRRMPPWGAVKGFGTFRNEQALSQEEIDLDRELGQWRRARR